MKQKVFVTRNIPGTGIALLKKKFQVRVAPQKGVISRKELLKGVKWCDALLCLLTDKINEEVYAANPKLKIVAQYAVGHDNIDTKAATKHKVFVSNTPGVLSGSVAEHAITMMMALGKRLHECDEYVRAGKYKGWDPWLLLGQLFNGRTIGIVGVGRIGTILAKFAHALDMHIIYSDVRANDEVERQYGGQKVELDTLLKHADVVSIHVPLLPSTHHLINAKKLKLMKKTAILVNTSRGPVVDEKALVSALKKKQLYGAGLDVYEFEPNQAPGLRKLPNVVLSPHTASATEEARDAMSILAAKNIIAALSGHVPPTLVNKDVLSKA